MAVSLSSKAAQGNYPPSSCARNTSPSDPKIRRTHSSITRDSIYIPISRVRRVVNEGQEAATRECWIEARTDTTSSEGSLG
jgi:hypothetical protein